jgi:hypothetical protein
LIEAIKINCFVTVKPLYAITTGPYITVLIHSYISYSPVNKMVLAIKVLKAPIGIWRKYLGWQIK